MKRVQLILIVFLICLPMINAGSVGISPANFEVFFEPNLERTFNFRVSNADPDSGVEVYAAGDLAEYVKLSDDFFIGKGDVEVSLKLPSKIEIPGKHRILIGAKESTGKDGSSDATGVGGIAAIQAVIEVIVPYPGKYIEAEFNINDINKGELSRFELNINNLGKQDINITPIIDIYEEEKKVHTRTIDVGELKSKEKTNLVGFLNTSELSEGIYNVTLTIDYGKELKIERKLKIGYLFVEIVDYSYQFISGIISPFNIHVKNMWNSEMKNVYSEVVITDKGEVLTSFKTPSMNLNPWQEVNLTGFFDASDIKEGKYTANINVFYEEELNNKLVAIYVFEKELNSLWIIGGVSGAVLLLIILIIFVYLIIKIRRLKKDAKKKNKK